MESKNKHVSDAGHRILFVCLGNICRSVTAEAVMKKLVKEKGLDAMFEIDSAGILDYHEGEYADPRIRTAAQKRGYVLEHRSRPVRTEDFYNFDLLVGMDDRNIDDLKERAPGVDEEKKIVRMADFCVNMQVSYVPDPYYGGASGFEYVMDVLEDTCSGLLTSLVPGN